MFGLKPEKPVTEICGKIPLILLVKLKVLRKIFWKNFSGSTLKVIKNPKNNPINSKLTNHWYIMVQKTFFSENVFLLKDREIGMLRNKANGDG